MNIGRITRCLVALPLALASVACDSYSLRGRTVEAEAGLVMPDKAQPGAPHSGAVVANTAIEVYVASGDGSRQMIASGTSGADGSFNLSVPERATVKGEVQLDARRDGYLPTHATFFLPARDEKLLVTLRANKRAGAE